MSDAVKVTIDDLLFVIGPNTSHVSNIDVRSLLFKKKRTTRMTLMTMMRIIPSRTC